MESKQAQMKAADNALDQECKVSSQFANLKMIVLKEIAVR